MVTYTSGMPKRPSPLHYLAILALSTILFGACTANPGQEKTLEGSNPPPDLANLFSTPTATTQPTSNSSPLPKKGVSSMKQLSDFEPVVATQATLTTTQGDITFELFRDAAPLTTANFLDLAKKGYYDGIVFHRVIPDFMAQVGDPKTKQPELQAEWGTGGPGYTIADEFGAGLQHDSEGIVSMANAGPNSGGSQFFITYEATPWLDGKHAIFGKVTQGMDVLRKITVGDKILKITYK